MAGSQSAQDTATVLKQAVSECLGDDFVKLNIGTFVSSTTKEVVEPRLQSFIINGWGADYGDPQNLSLIHIFKTPMTSYHEYNKFDKGRYLVEQMLEGKNIALITDAGTPGISDPGEELVAMCYETGIQVTSLPGAAACITALTLSGLPTRRFAFEAFLPSDKKERAVVLEELKQETRTIILYEAPHRLSLIHI